MVSPAAIALIVIGSLLVVAAIVYLTWPMLESLWSPKKVDELPKVEGNERVPGTELPPLLTPA